MVSRRITIGLSMAALGAGGGFAAAASGGSAEPVSVYPTAGTLAASPKTQISFRGADAAGLGSVQVAGSRTGPHSGRLLKHSDGKGASFFPDRPFSPGETVAVHARPKLVGAANGRVRFRIGVFPAGNVRAAATSGGSGASGSGGDSKFHSVAGLHPPAISVLTRKKGRASGSIFLGPKSGQRAAMMIDDAGRLQWYHPAPRGFRIYDFRRQKYRGQQVLTWLEWRDCRSPDCGVGRIYDKTYRQVDSVRAGNGYAADFHDLTLTPQNTAFLMIQQPVKADVRSVGGHGTGTLFDSIVQEIDVPTGAVVFEWHSLGHIPLKDSYLRYRHDVYDPYHLNSIDQESNGNLLLSQRNTNAVYEIDKSSGKTLWRLGGKKSSFKMGHGARFIAQHDARRARDGTITIFDNGSGAGLGNRASRGIVLKLSGKRAKLLRDLRRKKPIHADSQGGVQTLPTGGWFVGWGGQARYFTEFNSRGKVVYDAKFADQVGNSYRAYRFPWHGHPTDLPAVAASASGGKTKIWMSWNGATDVATWEVLAGPSSSVLLSRKKVGRKDFETSTSLSSVERFVQVRALDSHGNVLGTSAPTAVSGAS